MKQSLIFQIPEAVAEIFDCLENAGFQTVAVGGCVRDALLGNLPHDWDAATAATPEEMKQVLSSFRLIETGLRHGTLTVLNQGMGLEITTFRREGSYGDSRHPDTVTFTRSLEEDLARRDFTVNAMAYSPTEGLVDLFGGQEDLKAGRLRCVGDAKHRFQEDALRMVRAMRFASVLGFSIEETAADAMNDQRERLSYVAWERIGEEMKKLLCGKNAASVLRNFPMMAGQIFPELLPCMGFEQHNPHHFGTVWEHTLRALEYAVPELPVRLAVLLHDVGKPHCFSLDESGIGHFYGHARISSQMANEACRRLRLDNALRERVVRLVDLHDGPMIDREKLVRRRLRQLGEEAFFQLMEVQRADTCGLAEPFCRERLPQLAEIEKIAHMVLEQGACLNMNQLAISGRELLALGMEPGPEIGRVLRELLAAVSEGELANEPADLLNFAQQICKIE